MRRIGLIAAIVLFLTPKIVLADSDVELEIFFGIDAKIFAGRFDQSKDLFKALRVRHESTPLVLELNATFAYGYGANVLIDLVRTSRVRFYANLGVFRPEFGRISASEISRELDLVFGMGAEIMAYKNLAVIVDWRVYLPDPRLIRYYGEFYLPIARQCLKEGPLWLGLGWRL
jgi:hypothetical protein